MANYNISLYKNTVGGVAGLMFIFAGSATAAPTIQQVSGKVDHKVAVTIKGTGFGSKTKAAPVVWDDASGGNLLDKWDGYWPNRSPNATYNMAYRAPMRGIGLPHKHVSKYIAGAHGDNSGYNAGYNVILYKNRTISSYPVYTYASWYQRADDAWTFCGDNNYKVYDYSMGTSPYSLPENWYLEYNGRPTSRTSTPSWHINDDYSSLVSPDANGRSWWWSSAVNPMGGAWTKIEVEIKYTNQSNGYIKLWENGALKINYAGRTDSMPGQARSEGIGGYARCSGYSNNWRYFSDVYLDHTRARVVLANNADYGKATIIEPQIPSAWSDDSLKVTVNLGKFSAGQKAYLFVFDSSGQRNASGFPVTVGDRADTPVAPNPPTNLTVSYNN